MRSLLFILICCLAGEVYGMLESRSSFENDRPRLLPRGKGNKQLVSRPKQGSAAGSSSSGATGSSTSRRSRLNTQTASGSTGEGLSRSAQDNPFMTRPSTSPRTEGSRPAQFAQQFLGSSSSSSSSSDEEDHQASASPATNRPSPMSFRRGSGIRLSGSRSRLGVPGQSIHAPEPPEQPQSRRIKKDKLAKADATVIGPGNLEAAAGKEVTSKQIPMGKGGRWPPIKDPERVVVGGLTAGGNVRATARGDLVRLRMHTGPAGTGYYHDRRRRFDKDSKVVVGPNEQVEKDFFGTDEQMSKMKVAVDTHGSAHIMGIKIPKGVSKEDAIENNAWR